eukprot:scaffold2595_cov158-Amphora_coffeaeformis.AAC.3
MEDQPSRRSGRMAAKVAAAPKPPPPEPAKGSRRSSRAKPPPPSARVPPPPPKAAAKNAAKSKKSKKQQRVNPKRKSLPTFLNDEEGNQVWIAPLLANEIQRAKKTGKHPMNQKRLYLHTVAAPAYRQAVYERTARAWQDLEEALLPTYGGRKWKVQVTIKDPINNKGHAVSPFFCFHEGSLEIAVWPHWLLSIPEPPRFPGYMKGSSTKSATVSSEEEEEDDEGEEVVEEDEDMEELEEMQSREVSSLSELALSERWRVPVPSYSIKWVSPLRESFSSRKSAWEHAKTLCQNEVFLDKVLTGYNANGQPITKIMMPGTKTVLKAGLVRFLRDGLWVVGQEEKWQRERLEEMDVPEAAVVTPFTTPRKMSTLAYYIQENRKDHQKKRLRELSQSEEKVKFTLRDAETELRVIWKTLPHDEQEDWAARARRLVEDTNTTEVNASKTEGETTDGGINLPTESKKLAMAATVPDQHSDTESRIFPAATQPRETDGVPALAKAQDHSESNNKGSSEALKITPASEHSGNAINVETERERSENAGHSEASAVPSSDRGAKPEPVTTQQTPPTNSSSQAQEGLPVEVQKRQPETSDSNAAGRVTPSSESEAPTQPKPSRCSGGVLSVDFPTRPYKRKSLEDEPEKQQRFVVKPQCQLSANPTPSSAWCLQQGQIDLCYEASLDHYDSVISTVQARDLTREFQDGFDVLRERGKGRFDMELPVFDQLEFSFITNLKKTPWMPVVRQILGKDVVLIHKGVFLSMPGAETQNYHQDGVHLTTQYQKPCHAINVFVPLVDLKTKSGPTEFCLGSHILGQEDYDERFLETPLVKAGTPVIFDYRLGHRGLSNTSDTCRPILYCTYAAAADGKEFRDSVNFSRKRYHKIGNMVSKTPSREERAQKRQRILENEQADQTVSI